MSLGMPGGWLGIKECGRGFKGLALGKEGFSSGSYGKSLYFLKNYQRFGGMSRKGNEISLQEKGVKAEGAMKGREDF